MGVICISSWLGLQINKRFKVINTIIMLFKTIISLRIRGEANMPA